MVIGWPLKPVLLLGGVVYVVIDVSLGLSLWGACGVGGVGCQCMDVWDGWEGLGGWGVWGGVGEWGG